MAATQRLRRISARALPCAAVLLAVVTADTGTASASATAPAGWASASSARVVTSDRARPSSQRRTPTATAAASLGATPSESLPASWCGVERGTDDTIDALDNGDFRIHAFYVLPADSASSLAQSADVIQSDAIAASALLEQAYGRAIRFDMGTSCGSAYLDITTIRTRQSAAELRALAKRPQGVFEAVRTAVEDAGFDADAGGPRYNYVAWLDGPGAAGMCGQAEYYDDPRPTQDNLNNGSGNLAVIYNLGYGFCGASVVRHEIAHTLGAVQPEAPNATDDGHCTDSSEDTMCSFDSPSTSNATIEFFDFGNDDYWSPPGGAALPWWTVDRSRFIAPDAFANVAGAAAVAPRPAKARKPARRRARARQPARKQRPGNRTRERAPRRAKPAAV